MRQREFQGLVDALCQMAVSARLEGDLELLCQMPDGRVIIDLVRDSANHSSSGPISLQIIAELQGWIAKRLADSSVQIAAAQIEIMYRTDAVPTDRRRIVMFSLEAESSITTGGQSWRGKPQRGTIWHRRPGS